MAFSFVYWIKGFTIMMDKHAGQLKTEVVLKLLRGECPLAKLAAEYQLSLNQILSWKEEFLSQAQQVFLTSTQSGQDSCPDSELRYQAFAQMLDLALEGSRLQQVYDNSPRSYNGEVLYQVECHTIQLIGKNQGITNNEIARLMHKTPSAVSQIVHKLRKKGLLEQTRNPENNREYLLSLTPQGWNLFEFHEQYDERNYRQTFEKYFSDISIQEIETFIKLQRRFNSDWLEQISTVD